MALGSLTLGWVAHTVGAAGGTGGGDVEGRGAVAGRRIVEGVARGPEVEIRVDGRAVRAHAGESVATALSAAGIMELRRSPRGDRPRGMFCLMGVCQECAIRIDGRVTPSCQEAVRAGMEIELGGAQR